MMKIEMHGGKECKLSNDIICNIKLPKRCPHCGEVNLPHILFSKLNDVIPGTFLLLLLECSACESPYLAHFEQGFEYPDDTYFYPTDITPDPQPQKRFELYIEQLSPQFVEIYNQSLVAEAAELNHICGMGYRKAVEFLATDYAVMKRPDEEEAIKSPKTTLGNLIKTYIDDPKIQGLATAATWLGNDATHYIRKREDRDVTDMKKFIDAFVYFILMEDAAADAQSMINTK